MICSSSLTLALGYWAKASGPNFIGKLAEGGDVGIEVRAKLVIRAWVGFQPASKPAAGGDELIEGRQSPCTLTPFDRKESLG